MGELFAESGAAGGTTRRGFLGGSSAVTALWLLTEAWRFWTAERKEQREERGHERDRERQQNEHQRAMTLQQQEHANKMHAEKLRNDQLQGAYQQIIEACTAGKTNWGN